MASHPTAAELYAAVRRRLPKVSLGTIYRNLDVLHEDGMIRKMEFAGAETRFDGKLEQHYHVRCTECDRVEDIHAMDLVVEPAQPRELGGFRVTGHRLEFFGICPGCRNKEKPSVSADNPSH
jgi:Fur family ferric uptake transcriptional regulator